MMESQESLPITNNNLLPFLHPQTSQHTTKPQHTTDNIGDKDKTTKTQVEGKELLEDEVKGVMTDCAITATVFVENISPWYSSFLVFGSVFFISGVILTAIASFNLQKYSNTPIFGPIVLAVGSATCLVGVFLLFTHKKQRKEVKQRRRVYRNFSNPPPIQVREESQHQCFSITKEGEDLVRSGDMATMSSLALTLAATSKIKTRDQSTLRTVDIVDDSDVIDIPSSRRSSFHGNPQPFK